MAALMVAVIYDCSLITASHVIFFFFLIHLQNVGKLATLQGCVMIQTTQVQQTAVT